MSRASEEPSRAWWLAIGIIPVLIAGVWVLRNAPPTPDSFFPKCALFQWTGIHCPGCGGTRAVHALANFRFTDAVRFNPLLVVGLPLFLLCVLHQKRLRRRGKTGYPGFAKIVAGIVIAFFILRNVPTPKTSPFAPPESPAVAPPDSPAVAP